MGPINHRVMVVVSLLSELIARINGPKRHLRIQLPVVVSDGDAPEPDGSTGLRYHGDYTQRLPLAADALLS